MGKKMSINRDRLYSFLIYPAAALLLFSGCTTSPKKAVETGESKAPVVQQSNTTAPPQKTEVVDLNSASDVSAAPAVASAPAPKVNEAVEPIAKEAQEITPSEPRIFFEPSKSAFNQVLGIDFIMAENDKSRLIVTTSKTTKYDLDRKDEKTLVLKIHDSTIANPLLMRQIDTTQFQSALEGIKQVYLSQKKEVDLILYLREIVPFNVKPTDSGISMDFGKASVKVAENKLVPLNLAETETRTLSANTTQTPVPAVSASPANPTTVVSKGKKYKGEKMSMVFDNADVTYILKLINEVSGENIVWDPTIAGKKVSMILNEVPWDEALDLILDNNDLAKSTRGENIVWITTKEKLKQLLAEEEAERQRIQKLAEEEAERLKVKKEEAPLVTEYLNVDFAKAEDIKKHLTLSKRGVMSVDARTNTVIITDIVESIETAKKTIKQFDTPVKQIMIEARLVEASDTFKRDLGIKWNEASNYDYETTTAQTVTLPATASELEPDTKIYGGSFSTNAPTDWTSNIGLNFARNVIGGQITLDASLAIAETNGTAKTLSSPKVIAQEGMEATISSGEIVKIAATENVSSTEWPAVLSLSVTPSSISYNDYITLKVTVSDDELISSTLKKVKDITTTLMVKSGETIVIGGVIKESDGEGVSGIPLLKDIPFLGWLFKAKTKSTSKTELLIFLTPTVLPSYVK